MTFENEEGYQRACKYEETVAENNQFEDIRLWCGNHEIDVQEASEPSDIIWENRQFTPLQRRKKECAVGFIMIGMLLLSFLFIYWAQNLSEDALAEYPPMYNCDKSLPGYALLNDQQRQQAATLEYNNNKKLDDAGQTFSSQGFVQCFCDARAEAGDATDAEYTTSQG